MRLLGKVVEKSWGCTAGLYDCPCVIIPLCKNKSRTAPPKLCPTPKYCNPGFCFWKESKNLRSFWNLVEDSRPLKAIKPSALASSAS